MEIIKNILIEIQNFQNNLISFEYISMFLFIIGFMYLSLKINAKFFDYLQKKQPDDKSLTKLEIKKLKNKEILITTTIIFISLLLLIQNFSVLTSVLSILSFMLIMSAKNEVSNIIVGLSSKIPFLNTTIKEGQIIRLKNISKDPLKILKIKIFKTLLLDLNTEEIISIQNTDLVYNAVYHNPVKQYDLISYEYILDSKKIPFNEGVLQNYLTNLSKDNNINYQEIKKMVGYIKHEYEYFPSIKNSFKIKYDFIDAKQVKVEIKIKRFNYDYSLYNKEYMEIYKKINQK